MILTHQLTTDSPEWKAVTFIKHLQIHKTACEKKKKKMRHTASVLTESSIQEERKDLISVEVTYLFSS